MAIIETGNDPVVRIAGRGATSVGFVAPAATFTATTPTSASSGTKTKLTSAGAHGLTAAVAINKHIYISAGTNWTAGFYNISAITLDTTGVDITIDVAFNAGFGSPTIALVSTYVPMASVSIPALRSLSYIEVDPSWSYPNNANNKFPTVKWGSSNIYRPQITTGLTVTPSSIVMQNRGATNSQIGKSYLSNATQNSTTNAATETTTSIDTSVATTLTIGGEIATANDYIYLDRYIVTYSL